MQNVQQEFPDGNPYSPSYLGPTEGKPKANCWGVVNQDGQEVQQGLTETQAKAVAKAFNGEVPGDQHERWDQVLANVRASNGA